MKELTLSISKLRRMYACEEGIEWFRTNFGIRNVPIDEAILKAPDKYLAWMINDFSVPVKYGEYLIQTLSIKKLYKIINMKYGAFLTILEFCNSSPDNSHATEMIRQLISRGIIEFKNDEYIKTRRRNKWKY